MWKRRPIEYVTIIAVLAEKVTLPETTEAVAEVLSNTYNRPLHNCKLGSAEYVPETYSSTTECSNNTICAKSIC